MGTDLVTCFWINPRGEPRFNKAGKIFHAGG
ncbi:hypothetical protein PilKf_00010 [Pillotina sp. SPG140]